MKKAILLILCILLALPGINITSFAQISEGFSNGWGIQTITGYGGALLAENFSNSSDGGSTPVISAGTVWTSNNSSAYNGYIFVTDGGSAGVVNAESYGVKSYAVPKQAGQVTADNAIKINKTLAKKSVSSALDIRDIPDGNLGASGILRFEANVYTNAVASPTGTNLMLDFQWYARTSGAASSHVIGIRDDNKLVYFDSTNGYAPVLYTNGAGEEVSFPNNAWNHVVLDFNKTASTFDCYLNGNLVIEGMPMSPISWSGAIYRARLAYNSANNADNYIIYDDIMIGNITDGVAAKPSVTSNVISATTSSVEATFGTDMLDSSFDGQVSLLDAGGSPVALGAGAYNPATRTYTVNITGQLARNSQYTLVFGRWISTPGKLFLGNNYEIALTTDNSVPSNQDQEAADEISGMISQMSALYPEPVSVTALNAEDITERIEEIETLYTNASAAVKALVVNYSYLTNAKASLSDYHDQQAAAPVIAQIDLLGTLYQQITESNYTVAKAATQGARAAYTALADQAKAKVANYSVLVAAEERISNYEFAVDKSYEISSEYLLRPVVGYNNVLIKENFSNSKDGGTTPILSGEKLYQANNTSVYDGYIFVATDTYYAGYSQVDSLGDKSYSVPLSEGQANANPAVHLKTLGTKGTAPSLDIRDIPVENLNNGTNKLRLELNVYPAFTAATSESDKFLVKLYPRSITGASDVPLIAIKGDGTLQKCVGSDSTSFQYSDILGTDGQPLKARIGQWNHLIFDLDISQGKYHAFVNGKTALESQSFINPVTISSGGSYRIRMSLECGTAGSLGDVYLDDLFLAKYTANDINPAFLKTTGGESGDSTSTTEVPVGNRTIVFGFDQDMKASSMAVSVLKNSEYEAPFQGAYNAAEKTYTVTLQGMIDPLSTYTVTFDRWCASQGGKYLGRNYSSTFVMEGGDFYVSDLYLLSSEGVRINDFVDLAQATSANALCVLKAEAQKASQGAVIVAALYGENNVMLRAWASEAYSVNRGNSKSMSVPLDFSGLTLNGKCKLKLFVWDGLTSITPLWNIKTYSAQ